MSKEKILSTIKNAKYESLQSLLSTNFYSDEFDGAITDIAAINELVDIIKRDAESLSRDEYSLLEENPAVQSGGSNIGVIFNRHSSHTTLSGARLVESIADNILSHRGEITELDAQFLNKLAAIYVAPLFENSSRNSREYISYKAGNHVDETRDLNGQFHRAIIEAIGPKSIPSIFRDSVNGNDNNLDDVHLFLNGDNDQPLYLFARSFKRNERGGLGDIQFHEITPRYLIDNIMKRDENDPEIIGFQFSTSKSPERHDNNVWSLLTIHRSRDVMPQIALILLNDLLSNDIDLSQNLSTEMYKDFATNAELFINSQLKDYNVDPTLVSDLKSDIYISPFIHLDSFKKAADQDAFIKGAMENLIGSAQEELMSGNVKNDVVINSALLAQGYEQEEKNYRGRRRLSEAYNSYNDLKYVGSEHFVGVEVFIKGVLDTYRNVLDKPEDRTSFLQDIHTVIEEEVSSKRKIEDFVDKQIDLIEETIRLYKQASSDDDFKWKSMDNLGNAVFNYPSINPLVYSAIMELMEEAGIQKDSDMIDVCLDAIEEMSSTHSHEANQRMIALQTDFNAFFDDHQKPIHEKAMEELAQQGKETKPYEPRNKYMSYPAIGVPRYHDFKYEQGGIDSLLTHKHFCELQIIRDQGGLASPTVDFKMPSMNRVGKTEDKTLYDPTLNKDNESDQSSLTGQFRTKTYYISEDEKRYASELFARVGKMLDGMNDKQVGRFKSLLTYGDSFDQALLKNTKIMADKMNHIDRKKIADAFEKRIEILTDAINSSPKILDLVQDKEAFGYKQGVSILNNFEGLGKKLSTDTVINLNNTFVAMNNEEMSVGLIASQLMSMIKNDEKLNPRMMKNIFNGFGSLDTDTLLECIDDFCLKSGHYKLTDVILEHESMLSLMESSQGNIIERYHQNRFKNADLSYQENRKAEDETPSFDDML